MAIIVAVHVSCGGNNSNNHMLNKHTMGRIVAKIVIISWRISNKFHIPFNDTTYLGLACPKDVWLEVFT